MLKHTNIIQAETSEHATLFKHKYKRIQFYTRKGTESVQHYKKAKNKSTQIQNFH